MRIFDRRRFVPGALLAAAALGGCDAIIGLGAEPQATGSGGAGPTSTTTSVANGGGSSMSTGAEASAGSGGGGGAGVVASSASAGGGGDGGGGGTAADAPCGTCTETSDSCTCKEGRCTVRVYDGGPALPGGGGANDVLNRFGRGLAVTDEVFAFPASRPDEGPSIVLVDRASGEVSSLPGSGGAIGALEGPDGANTAGPILLTSWDTTNDLFEIVPSDGLPTRQLLPHEAPSSGNFSSFDSFEGLFYLPDRFAGQPYRLDLGAEASLQNPCRLSTTGIGTPADLHVGELDGTARVAVIAYQLEGASTIRITLTPTDADCGSFTESEVLNLATNDGAGNTLKDNGVAVAIVGGRLFAKTARSGTGNLVLSEFGLDGLSRGLDVPTTPTTGLDGVADRLFVPRAGESGGGIIQCSIPADDGPLGSGDCAVMAELPDIGLVHEIVARPHGFVALSYRGSVEDPGEALITCVDLSDELP